MPILPAISPRRSTRYRPMKGRGTGAAAVALLAVILLTTGQGFAQETDGEETTNTVAVATPAPPPGDAGPQDGGDTAEAEAIADTLPPTADVICRLIAENADAVGMPKPFFARLIWKESRFDIKAVSPVGARGIAQFMPYTADERGLADPYDYASAIWHSARYLKDIKDRLGNWGLAAAGYNGGPNRVAAWMNGVGSLPYETREYVNAITFKPVSWFNEDGREVEVRPLDPDLSFQDGCAKLPIMKTRAVFASLDDDTGPPRKPWGVQIAGHGDRSIAMRISDRVQRQFSGVLDGREPFVMRTRAPAGRIYAVRIGADSRAEGTRLCDRLRSAGGSCIVAKN